MNLLPPNMSRLRKTVWALSLLILAGIVVLIKFLVYPTGPLNAASLVELQSQPIVQRLESSVLVVKKYDSDEACISSMKFAAHIYIDFSNVSEGKSFVTSEAQRDGWTPFADGFSDIAFKKETGSHELELRYSDQGEGIGSASITTYDVSYSTC